jgi:hypothetical protein
MCDVINQSREECRNPRPWCAAEAGHQLITRECEIACCGGKLLIIVLGTCAEECRCGVTCPTCGDAAANLPRCISWVTSRSGGHDAECCPIEVAARCLTLRNCNGAIKCANLLNRRDGCAWSAPGFQECRHVVVIGDRQQQFAHSPEGIWRIGERFAADRLDARANLRVPLGRKCWCDCGEDAEIRSKLQGTGWVRRGKNPLDLRTNSFTREACSQWGIALDCSSSSRLHGQVEACNKSNGAQHAQRIFDKSFGWIANSAQESVG